MPDRRHRQQRAGLLGGGAPGVGKRYTNATIVIYSGQEQSACGTASNDVGPFYCPLDKRVYIDPSFYDELTSRFGADSGALAQEYVVAHEYGHHVQDILGLLDRAQQDPQGATSGSVRTELMADCLAGVWANHASTTASATADLPEAADGVDIRRRCRRGLGR